MTSASGNADLRIANPYLEIRVNQAHDQLRAAFHDAKEVVEWAKEEHSFWQTKRSNAAAILKQNGFSNVEFGGAFFEEFNQLEKAARDDVSNACAEPSAAVLGARDALIQAVNDGDLVTRESTIGQRLIALEKAAPLTFAIAIAMSQRANVTFHTTRGNGELSARVLIDAYRARFPARISEIDPQGTVFGERVDRLEHLLQRATEGLRDIDALQKTLRQKVATEAAVKVWRGRADGHDKRQKWLLVWVVVTFGLLGAAVIYELFQILPGGRLSNLAGILKDDPWMHFVLLGLPILAGIWIIRMLTVLYRVDVAGAQDAAERVAMVETLYALHAESKTAPNEAERMLVMGALFRPGPGADHDPSLPNTIVEQIARFASREQAKH